MEEIKNVQNGIQKHADKRKALRNLDLFVLDNSLRETTVGQLRGHTIENKWKIYEEVKKVGFKHIIIASFSHMTRVGDTFIRQLVEKGEDMSLMYSFTELVEKVEHKIPDTETIPIGLLKMKELGLKNPIIEIDLVYQGIDYNRFNSKEICNLFSKRIQWIRENLTCAARVLINLRDFPDAMKETPSNVLKIIHYLSSLPPDQRPFGFMFEDPSGEYLPEELGIWTAAVRKEMKKCGFQSGHLLAHIHEKWKLAEITQLECLANGATGIWAGLCEEGAAMGHASSCVTLMNLIRLGNKHVLKRYMCKELRNAAQSVTRITTGLDPHPMQPVYGERALDVISISADQCTESKNDQFSLANFFGEKPVIRISTVASPKMVSDRLKTLFDEDEQFTEERGKRMLEVMLEDLHHNRKEEYMSEVGLAVLFHRSGGKLTAKMRDVISNTEPKTVHIRQLIAQIRKTWNEMIKKEIKRADCLNFDSFYNGFMAPYFRCYRCEETRHALQAIDMDSNGKVDWAEFALYLKWAGHQYPETNDAEELLSIAFRKGLIPSRPTKERPPVRQVVWEAKDLGNANGGQFLSRRISSSVCVLF